MSRKKNHTFTPKERLERDRLDDDLFKILEDHLCGVARGILRARLEALCNDERHGGKDALTLYTEAHISHKNAKKLLTLLGVEKKFKEPDTLYGWLKLLSQKNYGHRHLEDFHHLIKEVKPRRSMVLPLFLMTLATAISSIYLAVMPKQIQAIEAFIVKNVPIVTHFLRSTFSVLKNIPLVVLFYQIFDIPYQTFRSIFHNTMKSPAKQLQKWIANTMPSVFALTSYALAYAAKGVFTPLAVGFFIASSLVGVANSLINFYQLQVLGDEPLNTAPLEKRLDYIRQKERYSRTLNTVLVNLIASLLISITVILWGILPPSLPVMIGAILFIGLVDFTKNAMLTHIHTKGAEQLQKSLYDIARDGEISFNYHSEVETITESIQKGFQELHQKLDRIQQVNESLAAENNRLIQRLNHVERITQQCQPNTWFNFFKQTPTHENQQSERPPIHIHRLEPV